MTRSPHLPLLLFVVCILVAVLPGQESRPVDRKTIDRLLGELEAADFEVRDSASRRLRALGPGAHDLLRASLERLGVDARLQVEAILAEGAESGTRIDVAFEPSMLAIPDEPLSVERVLGLLETEAGFRFMARSGLDEKAIIKMTAGKRPALDVLGELGELTGRRWTQDHATGDYRFHVRPTGSPIARSSGPFRCSLSSIAINRNLSFGNEVVRNAYVRGQLDVEPRADVAGILVQPIVEDAKDDRGRSLVPDRIVRQSFQPAENRRTFAFNLQLDVPDDAAKKLETLAVKVSVVVPRRYDAIEIPRDREIPEDSPLVAGGLTVHAMKFETRHGRTYCVLEIDRVIPTIQTTRQVQVMGHRLTLFGVDGSRQVVRRRPIRTVARGVETLKFQIPDGEYRAVHLRSLAAVETRDVKFAFEGVDLP